MKEIIIYTDGGSLGNPGPGGYGAVLIFGDKRKEISGGYRYTTNNRMELMGVIKALESIKSKVDFNINIFTDSRLIYDAFNKNWIYGWEKKLWRKSNKDPVLNDDLWKRLLVLTRKYKVAFNWVKAHSGIVENEICDALVKEAAQSDNLEIDENYEISVGRDANEHYKFESNGEYYLIYDKFKNMIKIKKSEKLEFVSFVNINLEYLK